MPLLEPIRNVIARRRESARIRDARQMEAFLGRCEAFRRLLSANNAALEAMTSMGDSLSGLRPVSMNDVRSGSVGVVAAVGKMVEALCALAPGTYEELRLRLRSIAETIDDLIHTERGDLLSGPSVIPVARCGDRPDIVGGKSATLSRAANELELRIPDGFVLTAEAFRLFMANGLRDEIDRLTLTTPVGSLADVYTLSSRITGAVLSAPLPEAIQRALATYAEADPYARYAVRSSALDEDSHGVSFAGQYRSVLNVGPDGLADAYREVVASLYSATAMSYRRNRGLRDDASVMCVACLKMVPALAGGVMYTSDPFGSEKGICLVHGVPGLPVAVVDGSDTPDVWIVDKCGKVLHADIASKSAKRICDPIEGIVVVPLDEEQGRKPSVEACVVRELAETGRRLESFFGCPQDVEWAVDELGITILQTRDLEIMPSNGEADGQIPADVLLHGGVTASSGCASGVVHVVRNEADMLSLPEGAVMVVEQAHPAWAAGLDRVAALVAGHGSAAGHLANVAREYRIPAIVGLHDAVGILSSHEVVTVDASARSVFEGRIEERLQTGQTLQSSVRESPVMRCLHDVVELVIPLNLTNVASPFFSPAGCRTLHDITRFCHEMGVREMFHRPDSIPAGAARRLVAEVPTQYWVLDMGGGTRCKNRKTVRLEDIVSRPMQALWHGMHAIAWQGPPAAGAGDFLSVLMQATSNPALVAGAANDMAERNYFILDREYCNLQSRFGFHFSTVEGHASPFEDENYAILQFKGGGAGPERRALRARLVHDILVRYGMIVSSREDAVFARLENVSADSVLRAMVVMGHIIVHTRQLDMIMTGMEAVEEYDRKLSTNLKDILSCFPFGVCPNLTPLTGPGAGSAGTPPEGESS